MDKKRRYGSEDFEIQSLSENKMNNTKDDLLKKEISDYSNLKPEIVAQLIRLWMNGDEK